MTDLPQNSLERAVWWTEYFLRNGAAHLRAPSANMSWIDYYDVKFVLFLSTIPITAIFITLVCLKMMFKLIIVNLRSRKNNNKEKTQ